MIYKRMWNDTFIGLGPKSRVTLVNTYQMYHYTLLKNVNDDMILAKQSLSAAEKKELEKEIGKQSSRPSRK